MERAVPILPVDYLATARQFYVDGLGFQITFEATEDGKTGLLGVKRGKIPIALCSAGRTACPFLFVAGQAISDPGVRLPSGEMIIRLTS
ncbi:MAG: hypothetical protein JNJ77_11015 [Planctomycetia bacterium]|nr:hypothetical protein [Planctomycetia bacterium]